MTVNFVPPHSPLTQSDITRMPRSMSPAANTISGAANADTYNGSKKSSFLGKLVKTAIFAGLAAVLLKRFGQNSFMKVADAANMSTLDKVKVGVLKVADKIETPFIKGFDYIKGLINKGGGAAKV